MKLINNSIYTKLGQGSEVRAAGARGGKEKTSLLK